MFLSSFALTFIVCMFGRLIVCVFECLKLAAYQMSLFLFKVFANMYVWLHVSLFSITFLHSYFICYLAYVNICNFVCLLVWFFANR